VLAPSAAITAVQPAICWSTVTFLPTKHEVRTAAEGEEVRAKAGMAVSRVTRHTTAFAAPKPIFVLSEFAIIDSAPTFGANLQIDSLVNAARGLVHAPRLRYLNLPDD
jgi:hypothetical protein